jgi:hypothetical protein
VVIDPGTEDSTMTQNHGGSALEVSLAYYEAWTTATFNEALTHIDQSIVCDAPSGRLEGVDAFREFMEPFTKILTRSELIAAFGDDSTAVLMYDTDTVPVKNAPGAEYHKVRDGTITYIRIIFDRAPFDAARQASQRQ